MGWSRGVCVCLSVLGILTFVRDSVDYADCRKAEVVDGV